MKIKSLLPALFLLSVSFSAGAQAKKITRLEIKEKEVFEVGSTNILMVDTLIMHDKATIKFSPESAGILQANHAIVGKKCTILSRGTNGINSDFRALGTEGQNGGDLDITMHFDELGSLTIDTRGGRGGNGGRIVDTNGEIFTVREVKLSDGRTQKEVIPTPVGFYIPSTGGQGGDAAMGLNGGDGGAIKLTYSTNNFIPLFNKSKGQHKIDLLHTAGQQGKNGVPTRDGKLVKVSKELPVDGDVKLVNADGKPGLE